LLALAAVPAFSKRTPSPTDEARQQAKLFHAKLDKNQQILHALDRLTFGARPGDADRIRKTGLKKWIDLQLHPERISENPVLEAKLQPLESLRMTPAETIQHYPPPQLIRAVAERRQPPPEDPVLRAAVERLAARYRAKKGLADVKGVDVKGNANSFDDMEPVKPLNEVLLPEEVRVLRSGTPDQKRELLAGMPPDKLEDVVIAMPRNLRQQLMAFAPTAVQRQ
jgi:hypothetical protein